MPVLDAGLELLAKGYAWLPDLRRAAGRATVRTRLLGRPAVGMEGPDAARFFYDERHVRRAGALPEPVRATLFGEGGVQGLDGPEHRVRKAMFVALLMSEDGIGALVQRAVDAWDDAVPVWAARREIVLFDEAARVLTRAVCGWAGVPLADGELPDLARDLVALVDGFATPGPRHLRARRARGRCEGRFAALVEEVRAGARTAPPGSALDVVVRHLDADGRPLSPQVAAVELLNVLRPTVAISWFVAFAGHALLHWPDDREKLRGGDPALAEAWAHEVRRFYPFAPFVGGRAVRDLDRDGARIPRDALVLLDLYGQNHDPALWEDPYAFRPERFLGRDIGAYELVPQGAGDPITGHRCPGEQLTVAVLAALVVRLARLAVDVPAQDLTISLRRIPALPRSGIRLGVHEPR